MAEVTRADREAAQVALEAQGGRTTAQRTALCQEWIATGEYVGPLGGHGAPLDWVAQAIADARAASSAEVTRLERELAKLKARRFPILQPPKGGLRSIPWAMIEPQELQARDNHDQSLDRLAERGGLGAIEAIAVLRGVEYRVVRGMTEEAAAAELAGLVKAFEAPTVASAELEADRYPRTAEERAKRLGAQFACEAFNVCGSLDAKKCQALGDAFGLAIAAAFVVRS